MSAKRGSAKSVRRARDRVRERAPTKDTAPEQGIRYVETSALLAASFEGDTSARRALRGAGRLITSALTHAEAARAVQRARVARRFSASVENEIVTALQLFAETCAIVPVGDEVLARLIRSFPVEPVRSLDAIHLATVEVLGAEPATVTIVTRDARVRANARAMGWNTE
jgi:hypothetical protein